MIGQVEGQVSLFDLDTWSGKTFQEHSVATKEKISKQLSKKSSKCQKKQSQICLCLTGGGGANQDVSTMSWENGALLGEYTMHSFGESPREENASHLSQILEEQAPRKYSLSEKACQGILNRASRRGKELPEILRKALESQANA